MSQLPTVVRGGAGFKPAPPLSPARSHFLCPACFWIGLPQPRTRGSLGIESLLWGLGVASMGLLLLAGQVSQLSQLSQLPVVLACLSGLAYSMWRLYRRPAACPRCGGQPLMPEEAAYPPACSHFLFSTEPRRTPDENRGRSSEGKDVAQPPIAALESSLQVR